MRRIKWSDKYILAILTAAFIIGIAVSNHYGTYYDQYIEEDICKLNIGEYVNRIFHKGWGSIADSVEKDHGTALYYPLGVLCILGGQTSVESAIWHCYTFVLFFAGCLALYGIVYELFGSHKLSLASFGLLFLSPRFFAEGHYNNKDIVMMSLGIAVIYFGMRYIYRQKISDGLLFAVVSAFITNVKLVGIWFPAVVGITYLLWNIWHKELNMKKFVEGLAVVFAFLGVFLLITPAAWGGLIDFAKYCISNASSFSRWRGTVLYAGKRLEVPLPADYLPLQILYTTPPVLLLLSIVGHVRACAAIVRREKNAVFYIMVFVLYVVPLVYAVTDRELIIYNGWRHFYFIYGPLVIFMAVGCRALAELVAKPIIVYGIVGGVIAYLAALVVIGHPYQYSYINIFAERPAQEDWQLDYWCVGGYRALDMLYKNRDRFETHEIAVTGEGTLKADLERFGAKWNNEMYYVEPDGEEAKYVIINLTYDAMKYDIIEQGGYHLLFRIDAYGNCLYEIYEKDV